MWFWDYYLLFLGPEIRVNKVKHFYNSHAQVSLGQSWNNQKKVCTYFIVGRFKLANGKSVFFFLVHALG